MFTLTAMTLAMIPLFAQSVAWERAKTLGRGVNLSWLENYWNGTQANGYSDYLDLDDLPRRRSDMSLVAELGFQTVRLPVCFDVWYSREAPYSNLKPGYWAAVDSFISWAAEYSLKLILVNHHGALTQSNHATETERIKAIWMEIVNRYSQTDAARVFFEIYNEPHDMDATTWDNTANFIINAIRQVDPDHSVIVGGTDYNSIQGLQNMGIINDTNLIYTFHFYDPFLFTHQGASWVGDPVATVGIPYPYNAATMPPVHSRTTGTWGQYLYNSYPSDGTKSALTAALESARSWSADNNLPVFCGEWGSYGPFADSGSRCRHAMDVISIMREKQIPWTMWEWDQGFSFFYDTPSWEHIISCMELAYGFNNSHSTGEIPTTRELRLFPNPLSGKVPVLNIAMECESEQQVLFSIGNLAGQVILTGEVALENGCGILSLQHLPAGCYYLRLSCHGSFSVNTLVIQQ